MTVTHSTDRTHDVDDWRTAYLVQSCVTEVSAECATGRCGNCYDDYCGCPFCDHPSPTLAELAAAGRFAPDPRPTLERHPGYDPARAAALDAHLAARGGAR